MAGRERRAPPTYQRHIVDSFRNDCIESHRIHRNRYRYTLSLAGILRTLVAGEANVRVGLAVHRLRDRAPSPVAGGGAVCRPRSETSTTVRHLYDELDAFELVRLARKPSVPFGKQLP